MEAHITIVDEEPWMKEEYYIIKVYAVKHIHLTINIMKLTPFISLVISMIFTLICVIVILIHIDLNN